MKIAYGTYALPTMTYEEAIPMLVDIGYDGVELCVSDKHQGATIPELNADRRADIRGMLEDHGLGLPAIFTLGGLYAADDEAHRNTLDHVSRCAELGRDVGMTGTPVVAIGFGGKKDQWDEIKGTLAEQLADYAERAEAEDFMVAGEAHFGAAVFNSERIAWLLDEVNHPRVRLHFDIVHLFLAGEPIADAVDTLVPYTGHTHITDANRHDDGSFELCLLGDGELDSAEYMRAMDEAGWDDFITLEVSTMVWGKDDYDPEAAARKSYAAITGAFEAAGVERT